MCFIGIRFVDIIWYVFLLSFLLFNIELLMCVVKKCDGLLGEAWYVMHYWSDPLAYEAHKIHQSPPSRRCIIWTMLSMYTLHTTSGEHYSNWENSAIIVIITLYKLPIIFWFSYFFNDGCFVYNIIFPFFFPPIRCSEVFLQSSATLDSVYCILTTALGIVEPL